MTWSSYASDLMVFAKVAEFRNFRKAGKVFGLSRSAVSKRISNLENELCVKLLNRNTRQISLTDAGRTLLAHCPDIEEALAAAVNAVQGSDQEIAGVLRIVMPSGFGKEVLPAMIDGFFSRHPALRMSANLTDSTVDPIADSYDVAFRITRSLDDSSLVARRLATCRRVLVASAEYLDSSPPLDSVDDLKNHRCLGLGHEAEKGFMWRFGHDDGPVDIGIMPAATATSQTALITAACHNMGILYVPESIISEELRSGELRRVALRDCEWQEYFVYAIYPAAPPPAKVDALIEFVTAYVKAHHLFA